MGLLNPSDHTAGGGLFPPEGSEVEITRAEFVMFDYRGTQSAQPALEIEVDAGDGEEYNAIQYTAGKNGKPSKDGSTLVGVESISSSTNFHKFMQSLVDGGLPEDDIVAAEEDGKGITFLVGLKFKSKYLKTGEREVTDDEGNVKKYDKQMFICDKVTQMPGGKGGGKSTSNEDAGDDFEDTVMTWFGEQDGLTKKNLTAELKKEFKGKDFTKAYKIVSKLL